MVVDFGLSLEVRTPTLDQMCQLSCSGFAAALYLSSVITYFVLNATCISQHCAKVVSPYYTIVAFAFREEGFYQTVQKICSSLAGDKYSTK